MINEAINKLADRQNLTGAETVGAFGEIMSGEATNAQIAAFITAMRMKGETIEEITACAQVLRENAHISIQARMCWILWGRVAIVPIPSIFRLPALL